MMAAASASTPVTLHWLLEAVNAAADCADLPITGIASDSRRVEPGTLFLAYELPGQSNVAYINDAVRAGAIAVIVDAAAVAENYLCAVPLVRIDCMHEKVGVIASRFYNDPSAGMIITGVTGTNGKSSVSHLLATALSECAGTGTGLIGTLGHGQLPDLHPGQNTTPEAVTLQTLLAGMRDERVGQVVIEVSSHGIDQRRIGGVKFDTALLTNLSRDHLDYHLTMEKYAAAKRDLFTGYGAQKAVINLDDAFGRELAGSLQEDMHITAYTLDEQCYKRFSAEMPVVLGQVIEQQIGSMQIRIRSTYGQGEMNSRLFGLHNASNLLAALATLCQQEIGLQNAIAALEHCDAVPGRMECIAMAEQPTFIVDYAHTPDALERVLQTLKPLCRGKLVCVFGCGGDRDTGKRTEMGRIAAASADQIVLTNDNPRSEDPASIIAAIQQGTGTHGAVSIITDRRQAIQHAMQAATAEDLVLVAGKGHERFQEINGRKYPFSDQDVIRELLGGIA